MILTLCFKKFVSNLSKEEIVIIDTVVSTMEYSVLINSLKNKLNKNDIDKALKSLIQKKIILTDSKDFLNESNDLLEIEKLYDSIKNKKNYFEILEIGINSKLEEIKQAYFKLSKKFHPDYYKKNRLSKELERKFSYISVELGNIYNVLKIKNKRREYIKSLNLKKNIELTSAEESEKAKVFYGVAYDEFNKNNVSNALRNIQLSLYYDRANKKYIKFYEKIKLRKDEIEIKKIYSNIDNLLSKGEFEESINMINKLLNFESNDKMVKKYQIKAWDKLDSNKYKNDILKNCEYLLNSNDSIENYELYLGFLKKFNDNKLEEIVKKMMLKYPKNKIAKNYIKKRSKWNIF